MWPRPCAWEGRGNDGAVRPVTLTCGGGRAGRWAGLSAHAGERLGVLARPEQRPVLRPAAGAEATASREGCLTRRALAESRRGGRLARRWVSSRLGHGCSSAAQRSKPTTLSAMTLCPGARRHGTSGAGGPAPQNPSAALPAARAWQPRSPLAPAGDGRRGVVRGVSGRRAVAVRVHDVPEPRPPAEPWRPRLSPLVLEDGAAGADPAQRVVQRHAVEVVLRLWQVLLFRIRLCAHERRRARLGTQRRRAREEGRGRRGFWRRRRARSCGQGRSIHQSTSTTAVSSMTVRFPAPAPAPSPAPSPRPRSAAAGSPHTRSPRPPALPFFAISCAAEDRDAGAEGSPDDAPPHRQAPRTRGARRAAPERTKVVPKGAFLEPKPRRRAPAARQHAPHEELQVGEPRADPDVVRPVLQKRQVHLRRRRMPITMTLKR